MRRRRHHMPPGNARTYAERHRPRPAMRPTSSPSSARTRAGFQKIRNKVERAYDDWKGDHTEVVEYEY